MKCNIKNMSPKTVGIFARVDGVDKRFEIGPGKEIVADNYETRIMQIYNKKGLISITPLSDEKKAMSTMEKVVDPNHDETLDKLHTTETHEVVHAKENPESGTEDIEVFKEKLMRDLTAKEKTPFEQAAEEVEQYVEDGYIKGVWSDEDTAFLKKKYPTKGRKFCSNKLNRNESSVQKKINSMGIKKKKKKK